MAKQAKRSFSDNSRKAEYAGVPFGVKNLYWRQKQNARRRGIAWELTFAQWWQIWQESGKFSQRGRRGYQYQMARMGDEGPYATGNVFIITKNENNRQAHQGALRPPGTGRKISAALTGRTLSAAHRARVGAASRRMWKRIHEQQRLV